jgi:Domain of unknown function (DUF1942)
MTPATTITTRVAVTVSTVAFAAMGGLGGVATASADEARLGTQHIVTDAEGGVISGYTVTELRPSGRRELDVPLAGAVPLAGELWQATITVDAVRGSVIPAMRMFNAQGADGQTYRVLEQALTPDLDVSPMPEGRRSIGNVYFDVTGSAPTVVTLGDGVDRVTWTLS